MIRGLREAKDPMEDGRWKKLHGGIYRVGNVGIME
jgi:hypothetical protein